MALFRLEVKSFEVHKLGLILGLFVAVFFCMPKFAHADTVVGGMIDSNTVWTKAQSPIIVQTTVGVRNGAVLNIEPGVIVKLKPNTVLSSGSGSIRAVGSTAEPIIFTSFTDDVGGDSNGDGSATTPHANEWNWVISANPADQFANLEVRYGFKCFVMGVDNVAVSWIKADNCSIGILILTQNPGTVSNNDVSNNDYGIDLSNAGSGEMSHNNVHDNFQAGIYIEFSGAFTILNNDIWNNQYGIETYD